MFDYENIGGEAYQYSSCIFLMDIMSIEILADIELATFILLRLH